MTEAPKPEEAEDAKRPAFGRNLSASEWVAAGLIGFWLIACLVFFVVMGGAGFSADNGFRFIMVLIAVVLPVAVIWLAASAARSARIMREESRQLQLSLDAMRQSYRQAQQALAATGQSSGVERKLNEIAEAQRQTGTALATFVSSRPTRPEPAALPATPKLVETDEEGQASLALGTPAEALAEPLNMNDLIRAINFPENAEDAEGFEALRRALSDRRVASLIQASQDVLTLLSQDGIYMDDLRYDPARPAIWRQFAQGARGAQVGALGGVRDRSSLALTAGRMKQDTIFRDAAHHFLRRFDTVLEEIEPNATDDELDRFGRTRTARAFMLLGRVTGVFS